MTANDKNEARLKNTSNLSQICTLLVVQTDITTSSKPSNEKSKVNK